MVTLERSAEKHTIKAFNPEYGKGVIRDEIRDDVVSYLAEYRFKLQKYNYNLFFEKGDKPGLRDVRRGESMAVKAQRAIRERQIKGMPIHRELAELKGIVSLENQLAEADTNDTVLWVSPPGPKDEGYGDYGFIYFGKVTDRESKKDIAMSAIRIENPSPYSFNRLISRLADRRINFKTSEDFLSNPLVINKDISEKDLEKEIMEIFDFLPNRDEEIMFKGILRRMNKMIEDFVDNPTMKGLYALENISLEYRRDCNSQLFKNIIYDRNVGLGEVIGRYGFVPPKVGGSCGSSSADNVGLKSNNILNLGTTLDRMFLEDDEFGSREFECPACHRVNIRPKGKLLDSCQHCGSKEVSC